jgi:cytochrome c-type biogenesis protein
LNLGTLFLTQISFSTALAAGLLSFFTPCVLPLIPAWLVLLTGLTFDELVALERHRWGFTRLFWPTLFFGLGFTIVFTLLGAAAGLAGELLKNYGQWLHYLAGVLMIFFGLYLLDLISPSFLLREHRARLSRRPIGLLGSFVVGLGFAAGWTPCVGPILSAILALAAAEASSGKGARLLAVYSLGLALPFLGFSLLWGAGLSLLVRTQPLMHRLNQVLGLILIALGLLVLTGHLNVAVS